MSAFDVLAAVRWLHFLTAMVLFGTSLFPLYAPTGRFLDRPLKPVLVAAAVLGLVTAVLWAGMLFAGIMGDGGWPKFADVAAFFLETSFGPPWLVHIAVAAMIIVVCAHLRRNSWMSRPQARILLVLAAALLLSQASIGHAAAGGTPSIALHAVHLLAAGAWVGGLLPLGVLLAISRRKGDADTIGKARAAVHRFSAMGMIAVGLVLATGIGNALARLGSAADLVATGYGRVLLLKSAFFLAMVALAAFHRTVLLPRLDTAGGGAGRTLIGTIILEGAAGMLVLGAVAVLGMLPPPQ